MSCKFYFTVCCVQTCFSRITVRRQAVFQHKQRPDCPAVFFCTSLSQKQIGAVQGLPVKTDPCCRYRNAGNPEAYRPKCKYDSRVPKRSDTVCRFCDIVCNVWSQRSYVQTTICCCLATAILFRSCGADKRFFNIKQLAICCPAVFCCKLRNNQVDAQCQGLPVKAALASFGQNRRQRYKKHAISIQLFIVAHIMLLPVYTCAF